MQLNKVFIAGNLCRDPELKHTPSCTAVADMSVAINREWKTEKGEKRKEVTFVKVVLWEKKAELAAKYLKKGDPVFVEGRLKLNQWEKNGEKRQALEVLCDRWHFLEPKQDKADDAPEPPNGECPY